MSSNAVADDELSVQIIRGESIGADLDVVLDGRVSHPVGPNGMAFFDLGAGQHSIQVRQDDNTLHIFRFTSATDQYADIAIDLAVPDSPSVVVETYVRTETAEQLARAARGSVRGRVTANGQPVAGARVQLIGGVTRETQTAADGSYSIEAPRGLYRLVISESALGSTEKPDFRVVANATLGAEFTLEGANVASSSVLEEVVVVGSAIVEGQQETERFSIEIVDALGQEQIARFGDSEISASVLRVPAVTVQDGKYIFVRGLGGRYISTRLNGASMPSTDPTRRTVPLDLFPSSIVEQLDISKSFSAASSGESTGGEVRISTRTFPNESDGKFSVAIGFRNGVTGENVWVDPIQSGYDFVGVDDGARERPPVAYAVAQALSAQSDFTQQDTFDQSVEFELRRLAAESISDGFDLDQKSAAPDLSLNVNYGDLVSIDRLDADFGYFVAASTKNQWQLKNDGIKRSYEAGGTAIADDFTFEESSNEVDTNGLIGLGFNVARSSYESTTILNRVTESTVRRSEGIEGETDFPASRWSINYEERQFLSQQFAGNHIAGERDQWTVDWQGTISRADRYAPDRREAFFLQYPNENVFSLQLADVVRRYDELTDENLDASTDIEYLFLDSSNESSISFGIQAVKRERDSDSDTYGFQGESALNVSNSDTAPNLRVDDVVNSDNITGDRSTGIAFLDNTFPLDSYEAEMTLNSAYVSYDSIFADKFQLVFGVRHESFEQTTDTFDTGNGPLRSVIEESSTLPSLSLNWFYGADAQIRLAASRTVARPDFKETTNAVFYDREFDFFVRGNPLLRVSDIRNYDLRWEKYLSGQESISVALFYKDLEDPIERVVQDASGSAGNARTFQNAQSAKIKGIEVDVRKDFALNDAFTKSLFLAVNASSIDSEVTLANGGRRPLQGAPDYSLNLIVGFDDISNGQEVTLLFNQSGDTIVDVGVLGQEEIIEEPRLDVDLNYRWHVSDTLTLRFQVEDLLDSKVEFTQGGRIFQSYKDGQKLQAGVEWNF